MRRTLPSFGLLLVALVAAGCEPPPGLTANSAILPLEGACPEDLTGGLEFTNEIDRLRIRVTGPDIDEPIEVEGSLSALTVEGIPVGEDRQVALYGLVGDTATWRGIKSGITVNAEQNTSVEVLLSKVADLSCPRSPLDQPRAFHTATQLADGRVLLVGGARTFVPTNCSGEDCTNLTAVGSAELYDPSSGTFTPAGLLQVPRMFHTATLLEDGRVAVVGGVSDADIVQVDAANPFPIRPRVAPTSLIEVWSPETNTFTPAGDDPVGGRIFHASALTPDGDLLITGGIPNAAPVNNLSNALRETTLCSGDDLFCLTGIQMQRKRAGHSLTLLENGDVLAWGGSVETGDELGIAGYKPEVYRSGQFTLLNTAGFSSNLLNLFFAATTRYSGLRVLAAGGLVRGADGSFALSTIEKAGITRGPVFVFDATPPGGNGSVSAGPYVGDVLDALVISEPRYLGSAAPLPGNRAMLAGGFSSLDAKTPSAGLELYSEEPFAVQAITAGGQPRLLRQARGGLVATSLGDGTVLLSGGAVSEGGVRRPVASGEIFTDSVDPGESR